MAPPRNAQTAELARTILAGYEGFRIGDTERRCRELLRTVLALAQEAEGEEPPEQSLETASDTLWNFPVEGEEPPPPAEPEPAKKGGKAAEPEEAAPTRTVFEALADERGGALLLSHAWDQPPEWDQYFSTQPFASAKQVQVASGLRLATQRQLARKGAPPRAWLDCASLPDPVSAQDHPIDQVSWGPYKLNVGHLKELFPKVEGQDGYTILRVPEGHTFEGVMQMRKFDEDNRPMKGIEEVPVHWEIPPGWFHVRSANVIPEDKVSPEAARAKEVFQPRQEQLRRWCTRLALRDDIWIEFTLGTLRTEVQLLTEPMIALSGGLVPILTWNYFDRLWPLCEWALFCAHRGPANVSLAADCFTAAANVEYHRAIRRLSVVEAECRDARDRELLLSQLEKTFACRPTQETQNFRKPAPGVLMAPVTERVVDWAPLERYVRATVIACLAREANLAASCKAGFDDEGGWIELAKELGLLELYAALKQSKPYYWAEAARKQADASAEGDEEGEYNALVEAWWVRVVLPVLEDERRLAVR